MQLHTHKNYLKSIQNYVKDKNYQNHLRGTKGAMEKKCDVMGIQIEGDTCLCTLQFAHDQVICE